LPEDATLVVYMPGRDTARIARELAASGVAQDMPCAAVSHAATARQSVAACRLDTFAKLECGPTPVLLLIGRAMEALIQTGLDDATAAMIAQTTDHEATGA